MWNRSEWSSARLMERVKASCMQLWLLIISDYDTLVCMCQNFSLFLMSFFLTALQQNSKLATGSHRMDPWMSSSIPTLVHGSSRASRVHKTHFYWQRANAESMHNSVINVWSWHVHVNKKLIWIGRRCFSKWVTSSSDLDLLLLQ